MKKILFIIIILFLYGCCSTPPVEKIIYVPVTDTVSVEDVTKIVQLQRELDLTRDSLYSIRDSIGEDYFVCKYKLARIKEYVRIAGKGNNNKYLRGWCKRVLDE